MCISIFQLKKKMHKTLESTRFADCPIVAVAAKPGGPEVSFCHQENMSVKCIHPQTPLLYSKTGVFRGIPIFLFLLQNIDCGYLLERTRRGGSNVYPQSLFCAKIRKIFLKIQ